MMRLDHEIEAYMDETEPPPQQAITEISGWSMRKRVPWSVKEQTV